MQKHLLRKEFKEKRAALSQEQLTAWSMAIANNCLKLNIWDKETFHLFLTIEKHKEVQTEFLLSILQGKDKNIVVSKSNFENNTMDHFLLTDTTHLSINSYGIPEPLNGFKIDENQIDVVFVPLLCADRNGNRVGYGKGFYDRFLNKCRLNAVFVGLSLFEPIDDKIQIDKTDVSIHYVVTPLGIYKSKDLLPNA